MRQRSPGRLLRGGRLAIDSNPLVNSTRRSLKHPESGYTLIELLIAVAVIGLAVISILNCFSAAGKVTTRLEESFYARWLAVGLKAELDRLPVVDPDQPPQFGCEAGEWNRDRRSFDDLDDYNGWSVSPPEDNRGLPVEDLAGYRCAVEVRYCDPAEPAKAVSPGGTDYVLCTIVVDREGKSLFRSEWLRTVRWESSQASLPPQALPLTGIDPVVLMRTDPGE